MSVGLRLVQTENFYKKVFGGSTARKSTKVAPTAFVCIGVEVCRKTKQQLASKKAGLIISKTKFICLPIRKKQRTTIRPKGTNCLRSRKACKMLGNRSSTANGKVRNPARTKLNASMFSLVSFASSSLVR